MVGYHALHDSQAVYAQCRDAGSLITIYDICLSRLRSGTVRTRWARGRTPASAPGEAPAVAGRTSMTGASWWHGTSTRISSCNACGHATVTDARVATQMQKRRSNGAKDGRFVGGRPHAPARFVFSSVQRDVYSRSVAGLSIYRVSIAVQYVQCITRVC